MQTGTKPAQQEASKPLLLGLVAAVVIGIIAPLALPHLMHPSMIYHIILHMATVSIAAFLAIVSMAAYRRLGGTRTLFMTLGFIAIGITEVVYLLQAAAIPMPFYIPNVDIEAPHVITLIMLTMFGLGVLKVNK